jgi:hypothetical protein
VVAYAEEPVWYPQAELMQELAAGGVWGVSAEGRGEEGGFEREGAWGGGGAADDGGGGLGDVSAVRGRGKVVVHPSDSGGFTMKKVLFWTTVFSGVGAVYFMLKRGVPVTKAAGEVIAHPFGSLVKEITGKGTAA